MKEPTEAQIKEFWEWCGLHPREVTYLGKTWTEWTNGEGGFESRYTPTIDLNNLFKYAVPKAIEYLMGHLTYDRISAIKYLFKIWLKEYIKCWDFESALFWVLQEVRENKDEKD